MAKKKIYLSPSDQIHNPYAYGGTNEAAQCRKIAASCKSALERCGFAVKTNYADGENAMYEREAESNAWGADYHVCIHTNAGGGKGAVVFVDSKDERHMKAAQPVYDSLTAISLYGSSYGIRTAKFHEIRKTNALCIYIEVDFHDNKTIAKWIVENTAQIGEAIAKGLCKANGVEYIPGGNSAPTPAPAAAKTVGITLEQLSRGSKGAQVKTLQRLLKQLGYKDSAGKALAVDGSFGPATNYALKSFQKKMLGSADGICGVKTWNKLLKG